MVRRNRGRRPTIKRRLIARPDRGNFVTSVLVVEDHPMLLESLRRGLGQLGYHVLAAETGEEGYQLAVEHDVDIVILDLMLPGRSGIEILTDLRQAGFEAPVLIVTARDTAEDRRRARESGADGYLIKPFAFTDLLSRMRQLLKCDANDAPSS